MLLNEQLFITYVNSAAESLLQIGSSRLLGSEIYSLFNDAESCKKTLEVAVLSGNPHTRRNEHIENPEECSIEVTDEGRIGSINDDGCPSPSAVAGVRVAPITVADHDEQQWKTWNNNDQCTLEYTAFQSAIE